MAKNEDGLLLVTNALHLALWDKFVSLSSKWKKLDTTRLNDIQERALLLLNDYGLVEIRLGADVRWIGFPYLLHAIFEVSGKETEPAVDRKIKELAESAPGWVNDKTAQCKTRTEFFSMAVRLTDRGVSLKPPYFSGRDTLGMLEMVMKGTMRSAPTSVTLIDFSHFAPSDLQREIWNALNGRGATADKLEGDLVVSRSTLFKDPGGLHEILKTGLIKNDRAHGGYYRPDAPPESY